MHAHRLAFLLVFPVLAAVTLSGQDSFGAAPTTTTAAEHTLEDYRHFRAIAIDLLGRMPNRADLADFERPGFDLDAWIDRKMSEPTYAMRLRRVYMDLLRLEPNLTFGFMPWQLYRYKVEGPDGPVYVYWRENQRRARVETDSEFCLSSEETGQIVRVRASPIGTAKKVTKEALDHATVLIKPWWLYHDYHLPNPKERYGEGWQKPDPKYKLAASLLKEPDGKPTEQIRICREEMQAAEMGHIYASGRKPVVPPPPKPAPSDPPATRYRPPPADSAYAIAHKGEPVACNSRLALTMSIDCGCGQALERCLPSDGDGQGSAGFQFPTHEPLGADLPIDAVQQAAQHWFPYWWSEEAVRYLDHLFASDEDFRHILTGKGTFVNGPLAQFYGSVQQSNCCTTELSFGMTEEKEPLFEPSRVPAGLAPSDASTWKPVADRGPHAAGILTMPIFLEKFASARSRAASLYGTFLCRSFVSENATLTPSTDPNLMERPGCSNCHAALDPLAAFFTRIEPGAFTFLPASLFPTKNTTCKKNAKGKLNGQCDALYDVAFADEGGALLRSAYGSTEHADAGAAGLAREVVALPEFASCAVEHVLSSLLGRATEEGDAPLITSLTTQFQHSGFKMKPVVHGILRSDAYRHADNLGGGGGGSDK